MADIIIIGKTNQPGEARNAKNHVVDRAWENSYFQAKLTEIAADSKAYENFKALVKFRKEHYTNTGNSVLMNIMSAMAYKLDRLSEDLYLKQKAATSPFETKSSVNLGNDNIFTSLA